MIITRTRILMQIVFFSKNPRTIISKHIICFLRQRFKKKLLKLSLNFSQKNN